MLQLPHESSPITSDLRARPTLTMYRWMRAVTQRVVQPLFDVADYGAFPNGQVAQPGIQRAIDAASAAGGGIVFFPAGVYVLKSGLRHALGVSYMGVGYVNGGVGSTLLWKPDTNVGGNILDTTNISVAGTRIEGLRFRRDASITAAVNGIYAGADILIYNSTLLTIAACLFDNLTNAIIDNFDEVSLFDWCVYDTWIRDCVVGLNLFGSGSFFYGCKISTCTTAGVRLSGPLSGAVSAAGAQFVNCTFISNLVDIEVPTGVTYLRNSSWTGCWFEGSTNGIVNIVDPGTPLSTWAFNNCQLSTQDTTALMDFTNAIGQISVRDCTAFTGGVGTSQTIVPPSSSAGRLIKDTIWGIDSGGGAIYVDDWISYSPTITNTGGGMTYTLRAAKYALRGGKLCHVYLDFDVTNGGGGGFIDVTVPFAADTYGGVFTGGENVTAGIGVHGFITGGGARLRGAANNPLAVNGYSIHVAATYIIA